VNREVHSLGYIAAKVETLEREMLAVKSTITEIKTVLDQTKGGWRVLIIFGTISSTISAGVASLVHWFNAKGGQ
jgi:hypothetical protein